MALYFSSAFLYLNVKWHSESQRQRLIDWMTRRALGFSVLRFWLFFWSGLRFLCQKTSVSRFWCSLQFADFPFFSIWFSLFAKNTNGFSDLITDVVLGFSYLTYLGSSFSSIWAAITRLHWSRIAAKRKCYREECVKNQLKYRRAPFPRVGGREGTATRRVRLSTEHCQSFFINATSKLVTKLQATRDWLIQHSNRISKLSGLSSQMEMLD